MLAGHLQINPDVDHMKELREQSHEYITDGKTANMGMR